MDRHSFSKSSNSRLSLSLYALISLFLLLSFGVIGTSAVPTPTSHSSSTVSVRSSRVAVTTSAEVELTTTSASETETSSSPTPTADSGDDYIFEKPRAFDTSIALNNFTSDGCQPFFQEFLNNQTFIDCLPLSFFLQNSKSWFDITKKGLIPVTKALDASCSVDTQKCNAVMNELGRNLLEVRNCGADFKARNPVVLQAYASFLTYPIMFAAGCQRSATGYCYADAITNTTNAADVYVYFMPLGIPIPGGARLTCSSCLQKTMRIYSQAANNQSLPLSSTYVSGAQLINLGCGPSFVNTTIADVSNAATSLGSRTWLSLVTALTMISMFLI